MSERHHVERFAELLDEAGRRRHRRVDIDVDLVPLVETAQRVATVPEPEPSTEFRDGLRTLLMATIAREGIGASEAAKAALVAQTQPIRQLSAARPGRARVAVIVGVAIGALALSGVSLASTDSLPGDALYSVKRSSEQAQLVLAGSDANRGHLHLEFAQSRLVEARQVDGGALSKVLAAMDDEAIEGSKLLFTSAMQNREASSIDAVLAFVTQQRSDLLRLVADRPQADGKLRSSLELLGQVEERANLLRAALLGACTAATFDRLGPSPTCASGV